MKSRPISEIDPNERLVTHKEAAHILGMTVRGFYELCYRGEGPKRVVRLGARDRRYYLSDIHELITKNTEEGER